MSITPVEENEGGKNREQPRDDRPGVRARLQSWLAAVGERIRSAVTPTDEEDDSRDSDPSQSGQIRVAGQRRLTAQQGSTAQSEGRDGPPPARRTLPGNTRIDTERDGETLRVYNPHQEEAFISSDTWTDIEE